MRMQETEPPTAAHTITAKTTTLPATWLDQAPRESPGETAAACSESTIAHDIHLLRCAGQRTHGWTSNSIPADARYWKRRNIWRKSVGMWSCLSNCIAEGERKFEEHSYHREFSDSWPGICRASGGVLDRADKNCTGRSRLLLQNMWRRTTSKASSSTTFSSVHRLVQRQKTDGRGTT